MNDDFKKLSAAKLHAQLLDMLGANDHVHAVRIIAEHHARELKEIPDSIRVPLDESGEQGKPSEATGAGDPISGALSMFATYIRTGDVWDEVAQQAFDRAMSLRARELERKHEQSEPVFTASMYGTAEAAEKARAALTVATIAAREPFPSLDPVFEYIDTMPSAGFTITEPLPILSVNAPSEQAGIAHSNSCSISDEVARQAEKVWQASVQEAMRTYANPNSDTVWMPAFRAVLQWYESAFPRGVGSGAAIDALREIAKTPINGKVSAIFMRTRASLALDAINAHPAPEAQAEVAPAAYCDPTDPRASRAFSWPGTAQLAWHTTPLYLRPQPSASETPSAKDADFESVLRPVVQWLNANGNPHMSIVVTTTGAELLSGQQAFETFDYVRG